MHPLDPTHSRDDLEPNWVLYTLIVGCVAFWAAVAVLVYLVV
jgi:hypothetical protein